MSRMIYLTIGTMTSILLLLSCSSDDPGGSDPQTINLTGRIEGTVADAAGNAYPNTTIKASKDSERQEGTTSSAGRYTLSTRDIGTYSVDLTPPLSTEITSATPLSVEVSETSPAKADFVVEPKPVRANLIVGNVDIFGELKNESGNSPSGSDLIYAANVFDPPFGQLTEVKAPDGHHVSLPEWKQASGELLATCSGNKSDVTINLEGLIPGGTYTFWFNFLNKKKTVGQPVDFPNDVVSGEPLGASNGSENIAIADAEGNINVGVEHDSCVLTREVALVLVVIYHINGNTYGSAHIPDPEEISQLLFYFQ